MKQSSVITIFIFFLLLLINDYTGYSQFKSYTEVVELSKKQKVTEKVVDSILKTYTNRDKSFANVAHSFSFFFYRVKRNYDLAIKYGLVEVKTLDSLKIINKAHTNAYYNLGKFYNRKRSFYEAIRFYDRATKSNKFPEKVAQAYCQLGECYFHLGDYYKSTNFYIKGINLLEIHGVKSSIVKQYIRFSFNCNQMATKRSTSLGILYLKKGDSIVKNTPGLKINKIVYQSLLGSLANLYSLRHQYSFEKANFYYRKILSNANDSVTIANTFLNIGELYLKKDLDSSFDFLTKSIYYDTKKVDVNETYRNLSIYYLKKNNYQKALENIKKSINYNFKVRKNSEISLLSISSVLNIPFKRSSIKALKTKSEILLNLYKNTGNNNFLDELIENVKTSRKFVSIVTNYSSEVDNKFLWREEVSKNFALGIYAAYLLNDSNTIFKFMEANKAFLLSQDIDEKKRLLDLPSEITYNFYKFKKATLRLEEQKDLLNTFTLQDSLFNLKLKYQIFKDSIKKIHPEYLSLNQNITPITLEQTKENLKENDIVIRFSLSTTEIENEQYSLVGLVITHNKTFSFKVPNAEKTIEQLSIYRKMLTTPLKTKEELNQFKSTAYFLYNQLFPTSEIKALIKNKNTLIVPDITMENTPLEALISREDSLHYLVEDCNISYAYSLTFSELNKGVIRKTNNDLSLYSPIKFNNTTISSLPYTEKESDDIESIISGNFHQFDNANKSNFLKNSANSKIIHLATHANASGNPQIQFYDSILPLHELYTYKNNADLVVLSACETNLGEIKKGEGVLSLARGFFHSGANSVVSSLWKINDASTSEIMTDFYKNLKDNQSKTFALNNAKRSYLKNHSLSEKSPYYWASFVLIGDTNPVFESNIVLYISIILTFIVLVFLFLRRKVVKHKKHEAK